MGFHGRLRNWLTFGLTPEEEERYRKACLARDLAQARIAILPVLVAAVGLAADDYALLGLSWTFYGLSALRVAFLACGLVLLGYMRTVSSYRAYDRAEVAWGVSLVVLLEIVNVTRPHTFVAHAVVAVVAVSLTLLVIPNRFVNQVAVALGIVAAETLLIVPSLRESPRASVTVLLGMLVASGVAVVSGWQLHLHRRRGFLDRESDERSRAAAERSLVEVQRAETLLRATLESIADGFVAFDGEWRFVYVNAPAERILGIRREEVLGQSCWEVFPLTLGTSLEREYRRAATGEVGDFESFYEPWGRWFHHRCFPREGGGVAVYFKDITERKRAEEEACRGRQLSEALNRINQALYSTLDLAEIGQRVVAAGATALGSDTAGILLREGDGWRVSHAHGMPAELLGARMSDDLERHAVLAVESRQPVPVADAFDDERFNREHFRRHGVRSVLVAPLIARDEPLGVISFAYQGETHAFMDADVAFAGQLAAATTGALENARLFEERTRAEEALRQSREDLDRAQEVGQIGWWRLDTQRDVLTWSDETHRIFGVARGTPLTYEAFLGIVHPDDRDYVDARWAAGLRGEPYDIEHRLLVGQQVKWVREKAYLEFEDSGGLRGGFGITQDVTERKRAEEALRLLNAELEQRVADRTAELARANEGVQAERQRLLEVLETLPVMVMLIRPDFQVPFANRARRQALGEARGRTCYQYQAGRDEPCEECQALIPLQTGQPHHWEWTLPSGRTFDIHDFPFTDADGSPMILEMEIDITERRQAESKLRAAHAELAARAEQLRRLAGELTLAEQRERRRLARVLHDHLQQLLAAARLRTAVLGHSGEGPVAQAAGEIKELLDLSIEAARSLTAELSPPILLDGGLKVGLEWLAHWMADKHGLAVDLVVEEPLPPLLEDVKVLLFESVRELLFNAVKHAHVSTVGVNLRLGDGEMLQITVSDSGSGFDKAALAQVDGFGLFSIRERLSLIGGRFEIDSSPGHGSRFMLVAPTGRVSAAEGRVQPGNHPPPATPAAHAGPPRPGTPIRVLLADDHAVMREGLAGLLGQEPDIEVVGEAPDGKEAVRLATTLRPDVVLMDVSMPGLDGVEATRAIRNDHPSIRVIGLSTFEAGERAQAMRDAGADCYLTKSGPAAQLLAAIRGW